MAFSSSHRFDIHTDPPLTPDLSCIRILHRNEETRAVFGRRTDPASRDIIPWRYIRVLELGKHSAAIRSHLAIDGYVSINGFRRFRSRLTEDLSALNAAAVDLDFYGTATPPSWQKVIALIDDAVSSDSIPQPSILVRSGQGAWLLWLLVADNDLFRAPTAPPANQHFLRQINSRLASRISDRFPELGVDFACTDLARYVRIPGSVNSRSGSAAHFLLHATPWGTPLTYTLDALGKAVGVGAPTFHRRQAALLEVKLRNADAPRAKRAGAKNLRRLLTTRLAELERIEDSRGGFALGCRNRSILVIATTLQALHRSAEEISEYVHRVGGRCQPPLAPSEIRAALKSSADRPYRHANNTIAKLLKVSLDEANSLNLKHIRPDYQPQNPNANIRKGRKQSAEARRAAVQKIVREAAGLIPLRELSSELSRLGFRATLRTITRDMDRLDLPRCRRRGRRVSPGHQLLLGSR
jgi:hypothetical protein